MSSLTIGILGLYGLGLGHREQCVKTVDDFLGSLGLIVPVEHALLGFLDGRRGLDFSGIEVRDMRLLAAENRHRVLIVGITALVVAHAALSLATRHVASLKLGIFLQYSRKVLSRLAILSCAHIQQGTVIERHEVRRIVLEHETKVTDCLIVIAHLGTQQSTVEMCLHAGRFKAQRIVIVGHRPKVIVKIILHVGSVDEVARIARLKHDGAIHIGQSALKVTSGACSDLGPHDIGRGIILVQLDALVQVIERGCGILSLKVHLRQADIGTVITAVK